MTAIPTPAALDTLAQQVAASGGRAYIVGGAVRDALLDRDVKDVDVEVFGLDLDRLEALLRKGGRVSAVGRSFGVLKWRPRADPQREIDVSVPRRDSKAGPGHRGIAAVSDPMMSVAEAARRRDLTVNAILYDIVGRTLVDPWGGHADLRARRLQAVDRDTFLEDPLRALRVVQFAARLDMAPTAELLATCREAALDELPAERIQGEWQKLLLKAPRPSLGFAVARQADILRRVFPEVADVDRDAVLDRLVPARDASIGGAAPTDGDRWVRMLTGWLARRAPAAIEATLDRLWLHRVGPTPVRDKVLAASARIDDPIRDLRDLRHLSTRAELAVVLAVRAAEGTDVADATAAAAAAGILHTPPVPLLLGRDLMRLGARPGPAMGEILKAVYLRQLDGDITTTGDAIAAAAALLDAPAA